MDDLADVPEAGGLPGHGLTLLLVLIAQGSGVAAAVQALDIQAPAVFLLDEACAVAEGAVKQLQIFKCHIVGSPLCGF